MTSHLSGGRNRDGRTPVVVHGDPDFSNASSVHGTITIPLTLNQDDIKEAVRTRFKKELRTPGMGAGGDVHFKAFMIDSSTIEVDFEIQE